VTPLRLAIFHTSLPSADRKIGGVEAAVHRLACSFADHPAVDVTVLSCDKKPAGARYGYRQIYPFALNNRWARLFLLPFLLNFMDFRRYDVVRSCQANVNLPLVSAVWRGAGELSVAANFV
jgi:hypothetical protein